MYIEYELSLIQITYRMSRTDINYFPCVIVACSFTYRCSMPILSHQFSLINIQYFSQSRAQQDKAKKLWGIFRRLFLTLGYP